MISVAGVISSRESAMRAPALATCAGLAAAFGCGSSEEPAGYTSHGDASLSDVSLDGFSWPDADPNHDAPPGPKPSFDAGSADAGSAFVCSDKTGTKGTVTLSLQSGGRTRTSLLHVPQKYDPGTGVMLVLNFHGFTSAGWQQALLTRMSQHSDQRGFIVAYPEGVAASWNAGACCGTAWTDSVDDVQFVRALLDEIAAKYCIDPNRIYATGMSNGGFLSHRLGCELSDRIAAIAPVAGVLGVPRQSCNPARPVPVLHFHGTADPMVPYGGGTPLVPQLGVGIVFLSVAETMDHWRSRNGCSVFEQTFYEKGDAHCVEWPSCAKSAQTALCTIDGGGHTWPGGIPIPAGKTSADIDATASMLDFFEAHPLP
jgi:polyhydroxybutyrate depolymerase